MASFADKFSAVLEERKIGNRTLARMIDPDNIESARRTIRKWKNGQQVPTQTSRDMLTDALGLDRGSLDPDDEEDSLIVTLIDAIGAAKFQAVLDRRVTA